MKAIILSISAILVIIIIAVLFFRSQYKIQWKCLHTKECTTIDIQPFSDLNPQYSTYVYEQLKKIIQMYAYSTQLIFPQMHIFTIETVTEPIPLFEF